MWLVYRNNIRYSFEVPTETEAIEYCKENEGYKYTYVVSL